MVYGTSSSRAPVITWGTIKNRLTARFRKLGRRYLCWTERGQATFKLTPLPDFLNARSLSGKKHKGGNAVPWQIATSAPSVRLLARHQHPRRIENLPHRGIALDMEIARLHQLRHALFHLPPPERRRHFAAYPINSVERGFVLPDQHQHQLPASSEHAVELADRPLNVFARKQLEQIAAEHSVEGPIPERHMARVHGVALRLRVRKLTLHAPVCPPRHVGR